MSSILIFGGTTEGRNLAELLSENHIPCDLCVATEYGEQVVKFSSYINVIAGRLTVSQMKELYKKNQVEMIIDATHPFATVVSENIIESAESIPLVRFERPLEVENLRADFCEYFENSVACAKALESTEGNIFLTTGSKDLQMFCKNPDVRKRLFVRVLPALESLQLCYDAKLEGKQIIAMQGPFSKELNKSQLVEMDAKILVTKESGKTGGEDTKLQAAKELGIKSFVIKKPAVQKSVNSEKKSVTGNVLQNYKKVSSIQDVCSELEQKFGYSLGFSMEKSCHLEITLAGIGMGNPDSMTVEVQKKIQNADYIFGARRMLENIKSAAEKFPYYLAKDIIPELKRIQENQTGEKKVLVLFSGDTGFFSGATKLLQELKTLPFSQCNILPGISSIQSMAAKFQTDWQQAKIMSLHGVEEKIWKPELEQALKTEEKIFLLTSGSKDIYNISKIMMEGSDFSHVENISHHHQNFKLLIGYQLSYSDEKLYQMSPEDCLKEFANKEDSGLYSVIILKVQKD